MVAVLALTPILIAILLLLFKRSSWVAALAGAVLAAGLVTVAFPTPVSVLVESGIDYFPLILEVALILLFGMLLARLLESAGSMSQISAWVEALSPSRPLGVALVVFGIVPFAESVTGFGIGVTVGVPILTHLGCTLRQSAILVSSASSPFHGVPWVRAPPSQRRWPDSTSTNSVWPRRG